MEEESNDQDENQIKCPFISATRQILNPNFELQQDLLAEEKVSKVDDGGLKAGIEDELEEQGSTRQVSSDIKDDEVDELIPPELSA